MDKMKMKEMMRVVLNMDFSRPRRVVLISLLLAEPEPRVAPRC